MTQHCTRGEADCTCRKDAATVGSSPHILCEHWVNDEYPEEPVHTDSVANWARIPAADRTRCLDHLRMCVLDSTEGMTIIARWARQARDGMAIGSDDIRFHFGAGMAVRNILRQMLTDDKLPSTKYQHDGTVSTNWDDFYYGAIKALVTPNE